MGAPSFHPGDRAYLSAILAWSLFSLFPSHPHSQGARLHRFPPPRTRTSHRAASARPWLANKSKIALTQLAGEAFIIGRDADFPSYNQFRRGLWQRAGFELTVRQQVCDLASILWMVSAGMSLGIRSSGLEDLGRKESIALPLVPKTPTTF